MTTATDDAPAFATYVGPKGGRAWLVTDEGEQPVGYIQTGDGRPKRYADASEWATAVAEAGMTEQVEGATPDAPAPDAAPDPAPDAPPADPQPPPEPTPPPEPDTAPAEPPAPSDAPSAPADGQTPPPPDGGEQSTPPAEPDAPPDDPPAGEQSLFEGEPDFAALDATEETDVSTAATEPTTLFDDSGSPPEPSAQPSTPTPTAPPQPSATPSEPASTPAGEPSASPEGKAAKPPPITTGSFVSWGSKRGRVDMVVTNGSVPGIEGDEPVKGSPSSPAARVVVYEADGSGWKPTRAKVGVNVATLKRTAPLRGNGTKSVDADLVDLMAAHEEKGLDAQPGASAVKAVFERGLIAWPGEEKTVLTGEQWGLARVEAFLDLAEGKGQPGYVHDLDLLPETNPTRIDVETKANWAGGETKTADADDAAEVEETVRVDPTEVKNLLAGLTTPE